MAIKVTIDITADTTAFWGVQYGRQEANKNTTQRLANVVMQNEQITTANNLLEAENAKTLPEFRKPLQPFIPVPALLTDEEFLTQQLNGVVDQLSTTMLAAKEQSLVAFAKSLPPEALAQMIAAAGAPPLINA